MNQNRSELLYKHEIQKNSDIQLLFLSCDLTFSIFLGKDYVEAEHIYWKRKHHMANLLHTVPTKAFCIPTMMVQWIHSQSSAFQNNFGSDMDPFKIF